MFHNCYSLSSSGDVATSHSTCATLLIMPGVLDGHQESAPQWVSQHNSLRPFEKGDMSCLLSENLLLTATGIKQASASQMQKNMVSTARKKILEMLVERSLKKFSIVYTFDVSEDETMWENMGIDD